eukprot:tig00000025_g7921.t1
MRTSLSRFSAALGASSSDAAGSSSSSSAARRDIQEPFLARRRMRRQALLGAASEPVADARSSRTALGSVQHSSAAAARAGVGERPVSPPAFPPGYWRGPPPFAFAPDEPAPFPPVSPPRHSVSPLHHSVSPPRAAVSPLPPGADLMAGLDPGAISPLRQYARRPGEREPPGERERLIDEALGLPEPPYFFPGRNQQRRAALAAAMGEIRRAEELRRGEELRRAEELPTSPRASPAAAPWCSLSNGSASASVIASASSIRERERERERERGRFRHYYAHPFPHEAPPPPPPPPPPPAPRPIDLYEWVEEVEGAPRLGPTLESLKCAICLETFARPAALACGHVFCHGCLDSWSRAPGAQQRPVCPSCRAPTSSASSRAASSANSRRGPPGRARPGTRPAPAPAPGRIPEAEAAVEGPRPGFMRALDFLGDGPRRPPSLPPAPVAASPGACCRRRRCRALPATGRSRRPRMDRGVASGAGAGRSGLADRAGGAAGAAGRRGVEDFFDPLGVDAALLDDVAFDAALLRDIDAPVRAPRRAQRPAQLQAPAAPPAPEPAAAPAPAPAPAAIAEALPGPIDIGSPRGPDAGFPFDLDFL